MSQEMVTAVQVMTVILTVIAVFSLVIGVVAYIFQAIGLYSISRRRKLGTSGFAWIPILNLFKLGQIADDAVLKKKGEKPHFMVFYPVSQLAGMIITSIGTYVFIIASGISESFIRAIQNGNYEIIYRFQPNQGSQAGTVIGVILFLIGLILVLISSVLYYICLYHIYRSCTASWVAFFVLSFFFSIAIPFFLFAIRKKDNPAVYQMDKVIEDPAVTGTYL